MTYRVPQLAQWVRPTVAASNGGCVPRFLPLLCVAVATIAGPSLVRPMWLDEFTTQLLFRVDSLGAAMGLLRPDTHHPLYFALLWEWHRFVQSLLGLRVFSLLLHAIACCVVGRLAWRLGRLPGASLALALYGLNPFVLRSATELRPYTLLLLTTAWSLDATLSASASDKPIKAFGWLWPSLALCALVSTHPVGIVLVASLALARLPSALGGDAQAHHPGSWLAWAVLPGVAFALLHLVWSLHQGSAGIDWMPRPSVELGSRIALEMLGTSAPAARLRAGLLLVVGVTCALQTATSRYLLLAGFTHLTIVWAYSTVATPILYYRSLAPLIPLASVATAIGWVAIERKPLRSLCLFIIIVALAAQFDDWKTRASLPIDQSHDTSALLQTSSAITQPIVVFPFWYDTTVRAELLPMQRLYVRALGQASVTSKSPRASQAIIRLATKSPAEITMMLSAVTQEDPKTIGRIVLYVADNDDVLANEAERQAILDAALVLLLPLFPGCTLHLMPRQIGTIECGT